MSASSKPIPIAMPNDLHAKLKHASTLLGLSSQDTMREALRIGLKHWENIGYDTAGAVLTTSLAISKARADTPHSLNETPPPTSAGEFEVHEVPLSSDEAEILELAARKRKLESKLRKAAARQKGTGTRGA